MDLKTIAGFDFFQVPLVFKGVKERDVFARKNNKTLDETLNAKPYLKLRNDLRFQSGRYPYLRMPLGDYLAMLKKDGDEFYKSFLNKNGDDTYTRFSIVEKEFHSLRGVYAYFSGETLKYIGRCTDNMKARVNNGYGRIAPKNCYKDGQSTNCHLNSLIAGLSEPVTLWLHQMDEKSEICIREKELIKLLSPEWNVQM